MSPFLKHVERWKNCTACGLCKTREYVVLARGSLPCEVAFIGEAPGESEDFLGQPFMGPAGKLLDQIIERAVRYSQLPAPTMAFSNLIACIPKNEDNRKRKGEPMPDELAACRPRLQEFFRLCQPHLKLIVCVGDISHKESKDQGWGKSGDFVRITHIVHPSAILHAPEINRPMMVKKAEVVLTDALVLLPVPF